MSSGGMSDALSSLTSDKDLEASQASRLLRLADSVDRIRSVPPSLCKALFAKGKSAGSRVTPHGIGIMLEYPLQALIDQCTIARGDEGERETHDPQYTTRGDSGSVPCACLPAVTHFTLHLAVTKS